MRISNRTERVCTPSAEWRREGRSFLVGAAVGAALAHLFDPERGRRRRRSIGERRSAAVRHAARRFARSSRATALQTLGHARGVFHRLHPGSVASLDEAGLAHKVESVLFRDPRVPKGQININAENGTIFLRGQLDDTELIDDVAAAVRQIPGVRKVVSLLHLPGTEAPHPPPRLTQGV